MIAIYKRELKSLFNSMIGFVFIALYVIVAALYFKTYNINYGIAQVGFTLYNCSWGYLLFAILPMKSLPEEKKDKIDQLLYTSPVSVTGIIFGKYLAMCTVFSVAMLVLSTFPIAINSLGYSLFKIDYSFLFAYYLLGCAYISICLFISSLCENQIISGVLSLVVIFILECSGSLASLLSDKDYVSLLCFIIIAMLAGVVCGVFSKSIMLGFTTGTGFSLIVIILYIVKKEMFTGLIQKVLNSISPSNYLLSFFYYYMFDIKAIVFYLSLIFVGVFLTIQIIQKRRYS